RRHDSAELDARFRGRAARRQGRPGESMSDDDARWRATLSPAAYRVTREGGTEPPFSGEFVDHVAVGVYRCVCCGSELFRSETKFDAHCGWPSFYSALAGDRIIERRDT